MQTFTSVEEARRIVLDAVERPQPVEPAPLAHALGRTLAGAVTSRDTIPPFDNSAMDGFAVRTGDFAGGTAMLEVIGEAAAGQTPDVTVRPGTCVRIGRAPELEQYVRLAGEDVRPGDELVLAGSIVTPPVIGMAATLGYAELAVRVPA